MAEPFDPYLKWLGIPPKQQPPNAYRLLGVELFESDADVISNAADQRMAHLKSFAGGEHSELSQKVLNEIAGARVRLLNAEKKAEYDRPLRAQLEEQKRPAVRNAAQAKPWTAVTPAAATVPAVEPLPMAKPLSAAKVGPMIDTAKAAEASGLKSWLLPVAIGGGLLAAVVVIGLVLAFGGGDEGKIDGGKIDEGEIALGNGQSTETTDDGDTGSEKPPVDDPVEVDDLPVKPRPETPPVVKSPKKERKALLVLGWPEADRRNTAVLIDGKSVPVPAAGNVEYPLSPGSHLMTIERPGYQTVQLRVSLRAGEQRRLQMVWKQVRATVAPEPPDPPAITKVAPPDADTKLKMVADVRELYADDFAGATDAAGKVSLAKHLRNDGENTKADPVGRFVLFETALDLATEGGDLEEALTIIDRIDGLYVVEVMGMKAETLSTVAKKILAGAGAVAMNERIVDLADELRAEALGRADVRSAAKFVRVAISAARKLRDSQLQTKLQDSLEELDGLQSRDDLVQKAIAALERTPDHPKANEVAGCWYCFIVGDWEKGLPWVAKAEDPALAELAKQDLAGPKEPAEQAALGDGWYDVAETRKGIEKSRLDARAVHWYKQALPKLTGLSARRLEKRLGEMGVSLGNYALQFDGLKSHVLVPNFGIGMNVPITVEALVKPAPRTVGGSTSTYRTILSNINVPGEAGLSLERYSTSGWSFRFYTFAQSSTGSIYEYAERAYCTSTLPTGDEWVHVAGVFDGRQIHLYVDGQLRDSEAVTGLHNPSRLPFMIGAAPSRYGSPQVGPTGFFNGQIKAVRVSQKILYTASFDPPEELDHQGRSTSLQFSFDAGSGSRVKSGRLVGQIRDAEWVKVDAKVAAVQPPAAKPPAATQRLPAPRVSVSPSPTRPSGTVPSFDHLPRRPLPPPEGATGTGSP